MEADVLQQPVVSPTQPMGVSQQQGVGGVHVNQRSVCDQTVDPAARAAACREVVESIRRQEFGVGVQVSE
jgi:hypothetical protein